MKEGESRTKEVVKIVLLVLFVFAAVYAVFLLVTPKTVDETEAPVAAPEKADETAAPSEEPEETSARWSEYDADEYDLKYLANWFLKEEGDFITITSWDPMVSPERSENGVRLIVGKVQTSRTLEEYVDEYLVDNVAGDPSYTIRRREASVLDAEPAYVIVSETALEGGATIYSLFANKDGEVWSIDFVANQESLENEALFNEIISNFNFK